MIACLAIQVYPIFTYLWSGLFHDGFYKFEFSIREIVFADFSAAAVLISFGAVVGKVSPLQLIFMTIVEILFYSLNENISEKLGVTDLGGSTLIHTFGAFFGVGVSLALNDRHARGHKDNSAVYHSDMFAMVGTLFLWMFWPSFNSVLGNSDNAVSRAVINTLLSLTGSGIGGFLFSYILRREKKFSMVRPLV